MKSNVCQQDLREIAKNEIMKYADNQVFFFAGATGFLMKMMIFGLIFYKEYYGIGPKKIIALARNRKKAERVFENCIGRKDFELIIQDVNRPVVYDGGIDYIIHGASLVNPEDYVNNPVETIAANTIGTFNLLELGAKTSCKSFLYISTSSVYGKMQSKYCREDECGIVDFWNYKNSYSEAKRIGEAICNSYCHEYGIDVKSVRPFYIYGSGMSLDDGRLFSDFIPKAIKGEDIILKSSGQNYRNFIYITDAIRDIYYCLFKGKPGEAYNIGNREDSISILEFATLVTNLVGKGGSVVIEEKQNKIPSNKVDVIPWMDKTENMKGMAVEYVGLKEGLLRLIESIDIRGENNG